MLILSTISEGSLLWEEWVFPAFGLISFIFTGFIWYQFDKRYVKLSVFAESQVKLQEEAKRIEKCSTEEAKRIEKCVTEEAKRVESLAVQETKRVEDGSKERAKANEILYLGLVSKMDSFIASRTEYDQRLQTQLTAITQGLGSVQGSLQVLIPLVRANISVN